MLDLLLSSVEYGGYISIVKFVVFLVLFFPSLPLLSWVHKDAKAVGTKAVFWTAIIFGTAAAATVIWLIVPVFIIGMLFYLIAVATASVSYVMHRNAKVPDFDRVLTAEHIKGLFASIPSSRQARITSGKSASRPSEMSFLTSGFARRISTAGILSTPSLMHGSNTWLMIALTAILKVCLARSLWFCGNRSKSR